MATQDSDILRELQNISFLLGDLNAIRNGEYDPPSGSGSSGRPFGSQSTPNELARLIGDTNDLLRELISEVRESREK